MRYLLFIAFFGLSLSEPVFQPKDSDLVAPQEMIDEINRIQDSWIASSEWVGQMTIAEAKLRASSKPRPKEFPEKDWGSLLNYLSVPASFDSRTQWPNCVFPVWDGTGCSAGWAFAASGTITDRFCIATNGTFNITLSPLYLIICDTQKEELCYGGNAVWAWHWMKSTGITPESCFPYSLAATNDYCPSGVCRRFEKITYYKAKSVNTYSSASSIQAAILSGGPVEATMKVYQDLSSYKGGIYKYTSGTLVGYTSVKLVGWGNQSGTNYWIAENSWGAQWGLKGYFWIAFGQCGIDSDAVAGAPDLTNIASSNIY